MEITKNLVVKSFIWKLLERFSIQFVSLAITLVLARILGPEDYGLVSIITVFVNLSYVIIDGGLNTALIQKKHADNKDFSTIFWSSIILSILLYLLLFLLTPLIADYYSNESIITVLRVFSIIIFFETINSIQRAYIARNMLFNKLFYSSIISTIMAGIVGIYMAVNGYGVWALVALQLVSVIITSIILWFIVKWRPIFYFSFNRFKSLFNYGWKIFGINFLTTLYLNIRVLIIGKVYSPSTLAFFERGHSLTGLIMQNVNSSLQTVLFPALSNKQDNMIEVKNMVRRSSSLSSFFIFPMLVGLIVVAEPLVILILSEKWLPAVPFIQIFSLAYMLFPMQVANMEAIKAIGKSGVSLKIEILKKVIETFILIVSVIINEYGLAWGVVIFNIICLFINLYPSVKYLNYGFKEQIKDIAHPLISSVIMGVSVYWIIYLNISTWLMLMLQILMGIIMYGAVNYILKTESLVYVLNYIKYSKETINDKTEL